MSTSSIEKAFAILAELFKKGYIDKRNDDVDLTEALADFEVERVLQSFMNQFQTILVQTEDKLYLLPQPFQGVLSYTNEELRSAFRVTNNRQLYTCFFCIISLLAMFYNGSGYHTKTRDFIQKAELREFVNQRVATFSNRDDLEELSENTGISFADVVAEWDTLVDFDENKRTAKTCKSGYINTVCDYLEAQELVVAEHINDDGYDSNADIYTTPKLDELIRVYYSDDAQLGIILDLMSGKERA